MAVPQYLSQNTDLSVQNINRLTRYYWISCRHPSTTGGTDGWSGFSYQSKAKKYLGVLCTLNSADAIPVVAQETIEFLDGGKNAQKLSFGKKIDPFNLMFAANDSATLYALIGRNQGSTTINSWEPEIMYRASGHLLVQTYGVDNALKGQSLYMDMQLSFSEFPGLEVDGIRYQQVTLEAPAARIVRTSVAHNEMINVEGWFHNGTTDTNADAPDGTETAFVLGTGNGSYSSATTPVALQLDSTNTALSGHRAYMIELTLDGAYVPISGTGSATFATSTITFAAAPAAQTSLMAIYVINPNTYSQANFSADAATQTVTDMEYKWSDYAR